MSEENSAAPQRSVFMILRVKEAPKDLAFLVKEAKWDTWFFPGGKVKPGEDDNTAMCCELKEETGLIVPRDFRLAKVKAYEYKDDNHNNHTNVLYTADLPMAYLLAEDSYRTKEHARHMGHKLRRMRHSGEQIPAFFDCPVAANTHAEIADGGARIPSYNCFSFAEIMPVSEVQNFLDIDAVDGIKLRGYGVRFPYAETKMWEEAFAIYNNPKTAEELDSVSPRLTGQLSGMNMTQMSPQLQKVLPKVDPIDGTGDHVEKLFPAIKAAARTFSLQSGHTVTQPDLVQYVGCCFTGKLGEWWSSVVDSASEVPQTVDALIASIQNGFSVKDYQAEHLIKLLELRQKGNSSRQIQDYGQMFVRYIDSWKIHMGWKLQAYLYIRGLNDENVRSELMNLVKSSSFDDVAEQARLQKLIARSATAVLNRSDPTAAGAPRRTPNYDPHGASSSGTAGDGSTKNGGGGRNGKGTGKGNVDKPPAGNPNPSKKQKKQQKDKAAIMQSEAYQAEYRELKDNMTPEVFKDHCDKQKCLKCHKKGHMLWQCYHRTSKD